MKAWKNCLIVAAAGLLLSTLTVSAGEFVYGSWNGPFHWRRSEKHPRRRLRTTEIAAIQDFPATYEISGSWRERVRQLGNAVPPGMASAMITPVVTSLEN